METETMMVPQALARWLRVFAADVTAGLVPLEEVIEIAVKDLTDTDVEMCPDCGRRPVREGEAGYHHGVCGVCWLQHLQRGHEETLVKLQALQDYNAAKQRVSRLRKELGIVAPRARKKPSADDYGRKHLLQTDHPAGKPCGACGHAFVPHGDETVCPSCEERRERRAHG